MVVNKRRHNDISNRPNENHGSTMTRNAAV